MKRIAVLSTNNNPDYFFYSPLVEWAWNKFGWEVAMFKTSDVGDLGFRNKETKEYIIPDIEGVRSNTLAQCVRHFVSDVLPKEDYIMVQDIDLIPLREWNPDLNVGTIWGHELTGNSFIPVHYTGMTGAKWFDLMDCTGDLKEDMEREMKLNGRAYQEGWENYWDADWDILTQKVMPRKNEFTFIHRGLIQLAQDATPVGRVDRYNMEATMNQENWIDIHCENHNPSAPEKWAKVKNVLVKTFGELPTWMDEHVTNHHNKYGQGR